MIIDVIKDDIDKLKENKDKDTKNEKFYKFSIYLQLQIYWKILLGKFYKN